MKKIAVLLIFLLFSACAGYCEMQKSNEIEADKTQQQESKENFDKKGEKTGAAVQTQKFEYKGCNGEKEKKACKIEDIIKEENKK